MTWISSIFMWSNKRRYIFSAIRFVAHQKYFPTKQKENIIVNYDDIILSTDALVSIAECAEIQCEKKRENHSKRPSHFTR